MEWNKIVFVTFKLPRFGKAIYGSDANSIVVVLLV